MDHDHGEDPTVQTFDCDGHSCSNWHMDDAVACRVISSDDYSADEILFDAKHSAEVEVDRQELRRLKNRERARASRRLDRQHMEYWRRKVDDLTQVLASESRKRLGGQALMTVLRQEAARAIATNQSLRRRVAQNQVWLDSWCGVEGTVMAPPRAVDDRIEAVVSL